MRFILRRYCDSVQLLLFSFQRQLSWLTQNGGVFYNAKTSIFSFFLNVSLKLSRGERKKRKEKNSLNEVAYPPTLASNLFIVIEKKKTRWLDLIGYSELISQQKYLAYFLLVLLGNMLNSRHYSELIS